MFPQGTRDYLREAMTPLDNFASHSADDSPESLWELTYWVTGQARSIFTFVKLSLRPLLFSEQLRSEKIRGWGRRDPQRGPPTGVYH